MPEMDTSLKQKTRRVHVNTAENNKSSPSKVRQVLVLLSCCYLRCIASGPQYGLSVMYVDFIKHWQAPRKQASLVQSVFIVTEYCATFVASVIIIKVGPGVSVIVGSLLGVLGFLASAFLLNSLVGVILCTGVIAGTGSAVLLAATWAAVAWSFTENRAACLVLISLGSSVGTFLFPYIADVTLEHFQLKGAFIALACILSTAIPIGIGFLTTPNCFEKGDHCKARASNVAFLRRPLYWCAQSVVALIGFSVMDPFLLVDIVDVCGHGRTKGATAETVFGIAGLLGKLLAAVGVKMTRIPAISHWSYCCAVTAICHCLLSQFSHYWLVILVSAISGTSNGIMGGVISPVMLEIVGLEFFPRAQSLSALIWGLSIFAGIFFNGALKDCGWRYEDIYYILAGALVVASSIAFAVSVYIRKMNRQIRDEYEEIVEENNYKTFDKETNNCN